MFNKLILKLLMIFFCHSYNVLFGAPFIIEPFENKQSKKMKNMKKILVAAIVVIVFASSAKAQSTATATATATIVTPIAIAKNVDMNFGNVAVTSTAGTVILAPAGTRTKSGGVTLPAVPGTVTAAKFTVTGEGTYGFAITLPSTDVTLTNTTGVGAETMVANAFTCDLGASSALVAGSKIMFVGATLNVGALQKAGVYVSAPFNVTVNYN